MSDLSLLWGVKRKSDIGAVRSESDPTETLVAPNGPVPETGFEPLSMRSIEPL
jgi:hypothetical protein